MTTELTIHPSCRAGAYACWHSALSSADVQKQTTTSLDCGRKPEKSLFNTLSGSIHALLRYYQNIIKRAPLCQMQCQLCFQEGYSLSLVISGVRRILTFLYFPDNVHLFLRDCTAELDRCCSSFPLTLARKKTFTAKIFFAFLQMKGELCYKLFGWQFPCCWIAVIPLIWLVWGPQTWLKA